MRSWAAPGANLAGTQLLRHFYGLNPAHVGIVVPVASPTRSQIQWASERARREAIRREREGIRLMRMNSPNPRTRFKCELEELWESAARPQPAPE